MSARGRSSRWAWAIPILVGFGSLAVLVFSFLLLLPLFGRQADVASEGRASARILAHVDAGQQALVEGSYEGALKDLRAADGLRDTNPDALAASESRNLSRLLRQCELLARLSSRSLQEIVEEAALVRNEEEWRERFRHDYQGKAVLFDDQVHRDRAGRPALRHFQVRAGDAPVRMALEDLEVLRGLPLDPPQRLIFGGKLAAVARETGGGWVIRFQPASGVLLTDPAAVASCHPGPLDDELLHVLKRQSEWQE